MENLKKILLLVLLSSVYLNGTVLCEDGDAWESSIEEVDREMREDVLGLGKKAFQKLMDSLKEFAAEKKQVVPKVVPKVEMPKKTLAMPKEPPLTPTLSGDLERFRAKASELGGIAIEGGRKAAAFAGEEISKGSQIVWPVARQHGKKSLRGASSLFFKTTRVLKDAGVAGAEKSFNLSRNFVRKYPRESLIIAGAAITSFFARKMHRVWKINKILDGRLTRESTRREILKESLSFFFQRDTPYKRTWNKIKTGDDEKYISDEALLIVNKGGFLLKAAQDKTELEGYLYELTGGKKKSDFSLFTILTQLLNKIYSLAGVPFPKAGSTFMWRGLGTWIHSTTEEISEKIDNLEKINKAVRLKNIPAAPVRSIP